MRNTQKDHLYKTSTAHALLIGSSYAHASQLNVPITAADAGAVATVLRDQQYCGYPPEQVTMQCDCRDFWTRTQHHGGVCKHIAARLPLFLAQRGVAQLKHLRDALDGAPAPQAQPEPAALAVPAASMEPAAAPAADALAFVVLGGLDLAAALFLGLRSGAAGAMAASRARRSPQ